MFNTLLTPALLAASALFAPLASEFALEPTAPSTQAIEASAAIAPDVDIIEAYATDNWTVVLPAGEESVIVVDGDGDTDLDVYLYDEHWNLIDSDTDTTDYCIVRANPIRTGVFHVKIVNLGSVWNQYSITVR